MKACISLMFFFCIVPGIMGEEERSFDSYTFEELANLEFKSATLTLTSQRTAPAAITVIDRKMIEASSARNLFEILEIFVPSLSYQSHVSHMGHIGMRGIISDRDDKVLFIVNGEVLNDRLITGFNTEKDLVMLGDIKRITVVRGPGSVLYGPGAISGVVMIDTLTYADIDHLEISAKQGFNFKQSSVELRFGHEFSEGIGIFAYYGISRTHGGGTDTFFSKSFTPTVGAPFNVGNKPTSIPLRNEYSDHRGLPEHKLHLHFTIKNFDLWLRYTQGGEVKNSTPAGFTNPHNRLVDYREFSTTYRQWSSKLKYSQELGDRLHLEMSLGGIYHSDYFYFGTFFIPQEYHNYNLNQKNKLLWLVSEGQQLAFLAEYYYDRWNSHATGNLDNFTPWSTRKISLGLEYQWQITEDLTSFIGLRNDDHTYSYKAALVYQATEKDTLKLIYNLSNRRQGDLELRREELATSSEAAAEEMTAYELRYERQHFDNLRLALSYFLYDTDSVNFDSASQSSVLTGANKLHGIDFELDFKTDIWQLILSHSWVKLRDAKLVDTSVVQSVTASPYGFGDDLANISNHTTKISLAYQWNKQWQFHSSLRYFWGYPGNDDLADFSNATPAASTLAVTDPGNDDLGKHSIFLNAGAQYKYSDKLKVTLNFYNILGVFDKKLNKRNHIRRPSIFEAEAPSVQVGLTYSF